jgi:hypothetical protein
METISIGFTGDFCPIARIEATYLEGKWKECFSEVKPFFDQNDFNIIDLECPLTRSSKKIVKTGPHLKAHPNTVEILKYLNCNYVATANNHFKDYDWDGMQETYDVLSQHKIDWFGSGENLQDASEPMIIEKGDLKVGVINMADYEWTIATQTEPGCNDINLPRALKQIQELKLTGVDFVTVVLHGGHEHYPLPSPRMKAIFRFMIDAGADAVVGHHTHIISGYETYKGKPIFYSLGNFCFDWPGMEINTWHQGMLLRIEYHKNQLPSFHYHFIEQNNSKIGVRLASAQSVMELNQNLDRLNAIINNDVLLEKKFTDYSNGLKSIMLSRIQPYRNRMFIALHKRGLLPDIMKQSKKRMLQILTQCETHREVLLNALKSDRK